MYVYVPSGIDEEKALSRTTHLAIAAHQDDIEIMAYAGILKCFGSDTEHFTGVCVTNGSGSPRRGIYADYSDEEMIKIRRIEQQKAAMVGDYTAQVFLDYTSSTTKSPQDTDIIEDIKTLILKTKPKFVYTHNLADKHETHVGVAVKVIKALRELDYVPEGFYGCEVWRSLDWIVDDEKINFDVSGHANLENALLGVFDSQIAGGKRYDLATTGRRVAYATYAESHGVDNSTSLMYAMDLTPLAKDKNKDIKQFVLDYINRFAEDVAKKVGGVL